LTINGVNVNTAITSNASAAYANAVANATTFSANATNITTGTLNNARLSNSVVLDTATQTLTNKTLTNPTVSGINNGPLAGFRNAIINGNFDIWQRGTSFSNPATTAYTVDRWTVVYDGSGATRTLSRQAFTLGQTDVPGEPQYFFRFVQSAAGSGGTFNVFTQRIEGVRTFAGQTVTVSFWAKTAAAKNLTAQLVQNFGTGGSPSSQVFTAILTSTSVGTSWTKYTASVAVPSISGKTIGSDNNDYLSLDFVLPINDTFTFDITQVQLEAGPVATPFERRPIGTELALCQRYYYASTDGQFNFAHYTNLAGSQAYHWYSLPVVMRSLPAITASWASLANATAGTFRMSDTKTVETFITSIGTGNFSGVVNYAAFSAEL
jgi:hypothetical protein